AVESVTASAPSVFVEQTFLIATEGHVVAAQFLQFENNRLHQSRERNGVVNARLSIANPKFNGVEERVQPDVPPNLLWIIDAIRRDQQFPIVFVFAKTLERVRDAGARKTFEDHLAICFQPGVVSQPKR